MKRVTVILQARMSSSRLPGKVLMPINGIPLLARQIERVKQSKLISNIVIATSNESSDDPIETLCQQLHVSCFRGSLHDVLDRFYQAALSYPADVIVRLTGDCPLIDAAIIDNAVNKHLEGGYQYTTNSILPDDPNNTFTYADGLDVEVVDFSVLAHVWRTTTDNYYREHVTSYIRTHSDEFSVGYFHHQPCISHYRLTIDQPEDLTLIKHLFEHFDQSLPNFSYLDVIEYLDQHPELSAINAMHNIYLERNND